jgi:hypothetical protein
MTSSHVVISIAERGIKQVNIGHCAVLADQAREEIRQWFERIVFSPRRKLQQFVEHNATMAPDVYAIRVWCKRATHDFHGLQIVELILIQIASRQKE